MAIKKSDLYDTYAVNQRVCALTAYRDCPEYLFYVLNRSPYFLERVMNFDGRWS